MTKMDIDPECGVAYGLKDGVALCRLMSKLQPGVSMAAPSDSSLAYKQVGGSTTTKKADGGGGKLYSLSCMAVVV